MSEQSPQPNKPDSVEPDAGEFQALPRQTHKSALANAFARMTLTQMTLAVLVVVFLWQWLDGHLAISEMQQQLAKKIAEMDGASKANQLLLTQSQDQVREIFSKVTTLETRYAEAQNQRAALEALYNDLSYSRDETALAEVEQLLLIAAQQLQLSANVKAALIAMQSADARLQRMDRPAFNGLRRAISQDMDKLRMLPNVDITAINFQLDGLIAAVDELPLIYQQRNSSEAVTPVVVAQGETTWQRLSREVWNEAKQLVRIVDTGKAEIPLLPPNQEFFLRENLKLRLLSARLALLSRDEDSYKQALKTVQLWTARHFDARSAESARMLSGLKKLAASSINIELPDISPSLQAVRNYRLTHEPRGSFDGRGKSAR